MRRLPLIKIVIYFEQKSDLKNLSKFGSSKYYSMKIKKVVFFDQNPAHSMRYFFGPGGQNFSFFTRVQIRRSKWDPKWMSTLVDENRQPICHITLWASVCQRVSGRNVGCNIYRQTINVYRKTVFYTPLFPYVSRKKTKRGPFLKVNAGPIFDKKCVFS